MNKPNHALRTGLGLSICAALLIALYYFGFTVRYPLQTYVTRPFVASLAVLNNLQIDGAYIYIGIFAAMFVIYLSAAAWLRPTFIAGLKARSAHLLFAVVFIGGIAFNVVQLPQYTYDAMDIYDYIVRGRMTALYGLNPLKNVPDELLEPEVRGDRGSDPFLELSAWRIVPGAYGAGWEWIAAGTARAAGDDPIRNVIAFKLIQVAGYAAALLFLYWTLRIHDPGRSLLGVLIFGWNPLVINMVGGGGHNDMLMVAFMIIAFYGVARCWYTFAIWAATLGATVKFIPLLLIPIIGILVLRTLKLRQVVRVVTVSAVISGATIVVLYAPFFTGNETFSLLQRRTLLYTSSYAAVIRQYISPVLDQQPVDTSPLETPRSNSAISYMGYALLAVFGLITVRALWIRSTFDQAVETVAYILLFYLIISTSWFQSWYVLWLIGLAALLPDTGLRRIIVVFSYLVTWQTLIYSYYSLRPGRFAPLPWRDLLPVSVFMGGIYIYTVWALLFRPLIDRWIGQVFTQRSTASITNNAKIGLSEAAPHRAV